MISKNESISGIICCFIGVLFGAFWVNDSVDWIIKYSTALGSIATAGSFIYIIVDNRKIRKAQEEQENRQIEHEKKQQEIWKEQSEIATFNKYKSHRDDFINLINYYLNKYTSYELMDAQELYKKIFPENNYIHCSIDINEKQKLDSCLPMLLDSYNSLKEHEKFPYEGIYISISKVHQVIKIKRKNQDTFFGDIIYNDGLATAKFNIFDLEKELDMITDILSGLIEFSTIQNHPVNYHSKIVSDNSIHSRAIRNQIENEGCLEDLSKQSNNATEMCIFACDVYHLCAKVDKDLFSNDKRRNTYYLNFLNSFRSKEYFEKLISNDRMRKFCGIILDELEQTENAPDIQNQIKLLKNRPAYRDFHF